MGLISILFTILAVKRKTLAKPGFEPRATGWEARIQPQCYAWLKIFFAESLIECLSTQRVCQLQQCQHPNLETTNV